MLGFSKDPYALGRFYIFLEIYLTLLDILDSSSGEEVPFKSL